MGMYDEYGEDFIQLKVGPCDMSKFRIGDEVLIDDGIYIAYEGAVVIQDGKLLSTSLNMFDKWGKLIEPTEFVENRNPVSRAIMDMMKNKDNK